MQSACVIIKRDKSSAMKILIFNFLKLLFTLYMSHITNHYNEHITNRCKQSLTSFTFKSYIWHPKNFETYLETSGNPLNPNINMHNQNLRPSLSQAPDFPRR